MKDQVKMTSAGQTSRSLSLLMSATPHYKECNPGVTVEIEDLIPPKLRKGREPLVIIRAGSLLPTP
jgi:hypothetical protein